MILKTERLILRPWEETDAESLYEYAKDPAVGPAAGWPVHTSVENSEMIIKTVLSSDETYAVCLKEDNRAIGSIGLMLGKESNIGLPETEAEIGFWIGVPFWGRGLIPEAVREIIRHGFADLKLEALWCAYFDGNEKSKKCQEKCGFVYHHTNNDIYWKLTSEIRTEHVNRLTYEEWKKSFNVLRLTEAQIPNALELAWKVFLEYEAPVYSEEGVKEFGKCLHDDRYLSGIDYYGAYDGKTPVGVLGIRVNTTHICFFFVDGRYQRLGLGTKLFNAMIKDFPDSDITLNSSPYGLPFYKALGFSATDKEQTVNGIRFTPMIFNGLRSELNIVKLSERRDLKEKAAKWFSGKWSVPEEAYLESIDESFSADVPSWYLCIQGEKIVAGMGVIENDFHNRKDLTPNVCAVYTEKEYRNRGIAGELLNYVCKDMHGQGIDTLYLLTDHNGFYERYGWQFLCMVCGDGEYRPSRMYVHYSSDK